MKKKNKNKNHNSINQKTIAANKVPEEKLEAIGLEAERIYQMFIDNMSKDLNDPAVYECVKEWQNYITKYYYRCSDVILARLAILYVNDKATKENLESFHIGLAGFMSQAIKAYLRRDLPQLPKQEAAAPVEEPVKKTRKKAVKEESEGVEKPKATRKKTAKTEGEETKKPKTKKTDGETKKAPAKKTKKKSESEE